MALKSCGYGILGMGMFAPEQVVTNADIEKIVDTTDEWIVTRSGIRERRKIAADEATSDMGLRAARNAMADAGVEAEELDLIIFCTFSPDYGCPSTACVIQDQLGIGGKCGAFDLNAACSGWAYGMSTAMAFLKSGMYKKILVIGADAVTRYLDERDRSTYVLFGDGAGAAVLGETGEDRGFVGQFLIADGTMGQELIIYDSGTRKKTEAQEAKSPYPIYMNGKEVFRFATKALGESLQGALDDAGQGLKMEDIDLLVPHQANMRIIDSAAKRMNIDPEKIYMNIDRYGNTSAASVPIALTEAIERGRLKQGDTLGLVAFGGGLTAAASIWIW